MKKSTFKSKNTISFLEFTEKDKRTLFVPVVVEAEDGDNKEAFFTDATHHLFWPGFDGEFNPIRPHIVYDGRDIDIKWDYYKNEKYRKIFVVFRDSVEHYEICSTAIIDYMADGKNIREVFYKDGNGSTIEYDYEGREYSKEAIFDKLATKTTGSKIYELLVGGEKKSFSIGRCMKDPNQYDCIDWETGEIVYDGFIDTPFKRLCERA